ncbi:SDR family oxidoreductase [Nostoc sp. FACHB-152]|uniref:SDR family NAD(P)-dependent oxidoreductase n=1 Tax=unclassified Nostoc TaxID=2593658 RepID=UPI00168301CF|nr:MULTISPECIES: SDR family oxidoreductase [unclassified Nostoc]MBD2447952.1 SDR family oxidoreductase [Nostoc sp. FACHB-152]MBD2466059.1 SDR family oxidoreductase [Nostoc sp. FACHB-145]
MNKSPRCIVCKKTYLQSHNFYTGICIECGNLNFSKRQQTADLRGMIAVVTGARVKIGYGVALRLLRDGATVIATSRFPHDTAKRYAAESDFLEWQHRLHIYGLDLRHLQSVEQFTQHICKFYPRLDIIINNAAQTVRRPPEFYRHLIEFESLSLQELPPELQLLVAHNHTVNNDKPALLASTEAATFAESSALLSQIPLIPEDSIDNSAFFPLGKYTDDGQQLDLRPFNSWLMKDDEVSILELLEVHIINAIAPFVINSRLKQLMSNCKPTNKYIINVSSMEGRFNDVDKAWRHPHTNMAKAALNQMTRTCAKEYAKHRIFMNAVDPGWISFQQPYHQAKSMQESGVVPPFDVADAAARICDLIYLGINQGKTPFAKLFKDYREIDW